MCEDGTSVFDLGRAGLLTWHFYVSQPVVYFNMWCHLSVSRGLVSNVSHRAPDPEVAPNDDGILAGVTAVCESTREGKV